MCYKHSPVIIDNTSKSDFEIIFCTITEYNILQYRIDFEIVKNTELIIQNSCKILVDIFQESE